MDEERNETTLAIIVLGVVAVFAIIGITITAITTSRNLKFVEELTGGTVILIAILGGLVATRRIPFRRRKDDD